MKVIIADDEIHMRKRLEKMPDWKALGFDPPLLCSDGDELLSLLETGGADLVLSDIRMPRMDGIRAIREARAKQLRFRVILMSAYDDKEYLKSALDLQVVGYLEKPFTLDQVQSLLSRAAEQIQEEKRHTSALDFAKKEKRREQLELAVQSFCRFQNSYEDSIRILKQEYPTFASAAGYYGILLRRRSDDLENAPELEAERCRKLLEEYGWCGLCVGPKREMTILWLAVSPEELEPILQILSGESGDRMLAVSGRVESLSELYQAYQDAAVTMERHFYHCSPVLHFQREEGEPLELSRKSQEGFRYALEEKNEAACQSFLDGLLQSLKLHDTTLVRSAKDYYFQLAVWILQSRTDLKDREISEYYLWELFYLSQSLDELHLFLTELLSECLPQSCQPDLPPIRAILEFIQEHLRDPALSLSDISRAHYMSVTYLCMYFKEKTGTTIKSYIIDCRMQKAAELLEFTDMKVAAVAKEAGFADQGYFTKSFSRFFGKSPSRYREECREKNI